MMIVAKLFLALALLVMAGVGGAQRNPQVTQHPNITNIEVKGMNPTSLRYRVCDDEEPSVNYTFIVKFFPNNQKNKRICNEGFADFLHNGYGCSLEFNVDNNSCHEILIGAWNARGYDTLCISIDIFYTSSDTEPVPMQVSYDSDFFLAFLPAATPTTPTDTTDPTDSVAVCASRVSENREQERNHILSITLPFIAVLLLLGIILSLIIAKQRKIIHDHLCRVNETSTGTVLVKQYKIEGTPQ